MPELPEVETVRRGLAPVLEGRRIVAVEQRRPDLRFPFPERFAERLVGARVTALTRRAKYLLAALDTGETLIAHLGMTGRFSYAGAGPPVDPGVFYYAAPPDPAHTHLVLTTDDGGAVSYNDPRRFGFMDMAATDALEGHRAFVGMGPEPLGPEFTAKALKQRIAGSKAPIKAALLDQRVVAGLGNIYVCEALHRAGISPRRAAGRIAAPRIARLVDAVRAVLDEAILAGGSTLRDFAAADGAQGGFQQRFRVYDRAEEACPTPNCVGFVRRVVQSGRSTFFCAVCQT